MTSSQKREFSTTDTRTLMKRYGLGEDAINKIRRRYRVISVVQVRDMRRAVEQERARVALEPPDDGPLPKRPGKRRDCTHARPCPFVTCRYHLYTDVTRSGGLQVNAPKSEPDDMKETCALDVADRGTHTLEEIGVILGVTRERIRQIQAIALRKIKRLPGGEEWVKEMLETVPDACLGRATIRAGKVG